MPVVVALAIAVLFTPLQSAVAQPASCRVGVDVLTVHHLDVDGNTFDADFWLWSVCSDDRFKPLTTMEFVNADDVELSLQGDDVVDGQYWSFVKVTGTFRYLWVLTDFPFDRHELRIEVEDSLSDATTFVYEPDIDGSDYEADLPLEGWRVTGFEVSADERTYSTAFGDPAPEPGSNAFSQLTVEIVLERDDTNLVGFFKLTFVVYIAFLLSLISYFINLQNPTMLTARLSVISGALFAVAVNLHTATTALSSDETLTLVGKIHVVALVAILIDAIAALVTQLLVERGRSQVEVTRFDRIVMVLVVVGFVAANLVLIGRAAIG